MDNISPLNDILTCPRSIFTLGKYEIQVLKENFKVLVARICINFCKKFKFLDDVVPKHIKHRFSSEMAKQSMIIPLPILDADEKKYSDCVRILEAYEKWIYEVYKKADALNQEGIKDPLPSNSDRASVKNPLPPNSGCNSVQDPLPSNLDRDGVQDQLPSNSDWDGVQDPLPSNSVWDGVEDPSQSTTDNGGVKDPVQCIDLLDNVVVSFGGDQLTRIRFDGAKDLRAGAHTPADRFEHCSPFKPAMWHTKASLLQYSYHMLYDAKSCSEKGTLKYFREKYNRKNATPNKVLDSYEGSEELFLSVGRAYIVAGLLDFFGMKSVDEMPKKNKFESNIAKADASAKKSYFDKAIGDFVDHYVFKGLPGNDDDDFVKNYALCSIFLTLVVLQMKDTASEGDGDRNLVNQKLLLTIFKSLGTYSKYAIEMFHSIAEMEVMLTQQRSEEYKWFFFSNWKGGQGKISKMT